MPTLPLKKVYDTNINLIKDNNPEWDIVIYDDKMIENFIEEKYPEYMYHYNKINPVIGATKAICLESLLYIKKEEYIVI